MALLKDVLKNTSFLVIGDLFMKVISLGISILIANYLTASLFGLYNFILSYIAIFFILTDLGLNTITAREVAKNENIPKKYIYNVLGLKSVLSFFTVLLVIFASFFYGNDRNFWIYVSLVCMTFFFDSLGSTLSAIFQGKLLNKYEVISRIVSHSINASLILCIVWFKGDLILLILIIVIVSFIKFIILYYYSGKLINLNFSTINFDFNFSKQLLKNSIPIGITTLFLIIYMKVSILMLGQIKDLESVGYYSAAMKLIEASYIIPGALMASVFPVMSYFFATSKESLNKTYDHCFKYIAMIAFPIATIMFLFSRDIINLLYRGKYTESSAVLSILSISLIFVYFNYVNSTMLVSINRQKIPMYILILCLFINIIGNLILIPRYSFIGAGISLTISEATAFIINSLYLKKFLRTSTLSYLLKPAFSSFIMGTFIYYLKGINPFLAFFLSIIVFYFSIWILKGFSVEDYKIFRKILVR